MTVCEIAPPERHFQRTHARADVVRDFDHWNRRGVNAVERFHVAIVSDYVVGSGDILLPSHSVAGNVDDGEIAFARHPRQPVESCPQIDGGGLFVGDETHVIRREAAMTGSFKRSAMASASLRVYRRFRRGFPNLAIPTTKAHLWSTFGVRISRATAGDVGGAAPCSAGSWTPRAGVARRNGSSASRSVCELRSRALPSEYAGFPCPSWRSNNER